MRAFAILTLTLLLFLLPALPARATSYVPMTDAALVDQAPVIAVVQVQGSGSAPGGGRPATHYAVRVERVLKGALAPGLEIAVRVPGGARADGVGLRIWGAPRFQEGERALLFLSPGMDGSYAIVHLMLGAFHEVRAGGHRLALRNLSEARAVVRPGEARPEEALRDFDRFAGWIADRVRGARAPADYRAAVDPNLRQITDAFTLFEDGGYNMRWFVFDSAGSVVWRAHVDGQQGVTGGGFTEFQTALAAWNNDPATPILYTYGGNTTNTNGLGLYDTVNTIVFNQNLGSPFSCSSGGVLAMGGPWYQINTTAWEGDLYHLIPNADIETNEGIACFFQNNANPSKAAEELFAHELGHTLGLGHSEELEALMYPYIHADGRGASLHADDRAGIAALYAATSPATSFFTLPPCRILDTRDPIGAYGGPQLSSGLARIFAATGQCGIPSTAVALSLNITVVSPSGAGYLTLYPGGQSQPGTSNLNFSAGQTRANNAVLTLSNDVGRSFNAAAAVAGNGTVHLLVDVNGYFE
jgi:Matrixin